MPDDIVDGMRVIRQLYPGALISLLPGTSSTPHIEYQNRSTVIIYYSKILLHLISVMFSTQLKVDVTNIVDVYNYIYADPIEFT